MLTSLPGGMRFRAASDQSLLLYFDKEISLAAHRKVARLLHLLEAEPIHGVINLHPAYSSLLFKFDGLHLTHDILETTIESYLHRLDSVVLPEPREIEIPVCYGADFGPDLSDVAAYHRTTPQHVIDLHTSASYVVYFLGFVPGFAYLGGLPDKLATPRLASPRQRVPAGSVAIGGSQTGVYPFPTPGGWRLIGRTPVALFRPDRHNMSLLSIGDHVRFVPISLDEFHQAAQ
jgi:KipI family sensor histidine kinase inhibitor